MKNHFWLYTLLRIPVSLFFCILFLPRIKGLCNIPKSENCVFIGNHTSLWDCLLLASVTPKPIRFLAMSKLFRPPFGLFFRAVGCISVKRNGQDSAAVREAIRSLRQGHSVCVFPEGKINKKSPALFPFHKGYGTIAMHADVPVLPFAISGKAIPLLGRFTVTFLPPVTLTKATFTEQNIRIMNSIQKAIIEQSFHSNYISGESL